VIAENGFADEFRRGAIFENLVMVRAKAASRARIVIFNYFGNVFNCFGLLFDYFGGRFDCYLAGADIAFGPLVWPLRAIGSSVSFVLVNLSILGV
jgi:hypothetical protein